MIRLRAALAGLAAAALAATAATVPAQADDDDSGRRAHATKVIRAGPVDRRRQPRGRRLGPG